MSCGPLEPLSRDMQRNPVLWDSVGICLHVIGYALTSSFFLANIGVPILGAHAVLILLQGRCEADAVSRTAARQAVIGLDVVLPVLGFIGFFNPAAGELLRILRPLRDALASFSEGRALDPHDVDAMASASADAGDVDISVARDAARKLGASESDIDAAIVAAGERMEPDDPFSPILTWGNRDRDYDDAVGSVVSSLANQYSQAYQAEAEALYAVDPGADVRPWFVQQLRSDLAYLEQKQQQFAVYLAVGLTPRRREIFATMREAQRRLGVWLQQASSTSQPWPAGAWSRSTFRRVVRSSELQSSLPVVVPGDSNNNDSDDGGGFAALAGVAAAIGLLWAAVR